LVTGDTMGSVRLFKTADASLLIAKEGHEEQIHAVAASPLGDLIASGSDDGQVRLWKAGTLEAVRSWPPRGRGLGALVFSKDGQTLFIGGGDGRIRRVSTETGEEQAALPVHTRLPVHTGAVRSLYLDRTGKRLVSAAADGKIVWWDIEAGRVEFFVETEADEVLEARVHPGGKWVASCGVSGTVRLWQHGLKEPIASLDVAESRLFALVWHPTEPRLAWSGMKGQAGVLRVVRASRQGKQDASAAVR